MDMQALHDDDGAIFREPAIVGVAPDGRPLVAVETFDKHRVALGVALAIRFIRGRERWEYLFEGHPIYVFWRGSARQTAR